MTRNLADFQSVAGPHGPALRHLALQSDRRAGARTGRSGNNVGSRQALLSGDFGQPFRTPRFPADAAVSLASRAATRALSASFSSRANRDHLLDSLELLAMDHGPARATSAPPECAAPCRIPAARPERRRPHRSSAWRTRHKVAPLSAPLRVSVLVVWKMPARRRGGHGITSTAGHGIPMATGPLVCKVRGG